MLWPYRFDLINETASNWLITFTLAARTMDDWLPSEFREGETALKTTMIFHSTNAIQTATRIRNYYRVNTWVLSLPRSLALSPPCAQREKTHTIFGIRRSIYTTCLACCCLYSILSDVDTVGSCFRTDFGRNSQLYSNEFATFIVAQQFHARCLLFCLFIFGLCF